MTPSEIHVGDVLPALAIHVTRTMIVAGAMATRDYEDVHHDPDRAIARGAPDIYMSINHSNGLIVRFVTDWAPPAAVLTRLQTKLGAPNFPGDTVTFTGTVVDTTDGTIRIAVQGTNGRGTHASAHVSFRISA